MCTEEFQYSSPRQWVNYKHHNDSSYRTSSFVIISPVTAKNHCPLRHLCKKTDSACNSCSNGADKYVSVFDMCKLVANYTLKLFLTKDTHKACCDSDGCVPGIPSGCKCIRLLLINYIDPGHGYLCLLCKPSYCSAENRRSCLCDFFCPIHLKHNLITAPVGKEVHP